MFIQLSRKYCIIFYSVLYLILLCFSLAFKKHKYDIIMFLICEMMLKTALKQADFCAKWFFNRLFSKIVYFLKRFHLYDL